MESWGGLHLAEISRVTCHSAGDLVSILQRSMKKKKRKIAYHDISLGNRTFSACVKIFQPEKRCVLMRVLDENAALCPEK